MQRGITVKVNLASVKFQALIGILATALSQTTVSKTNQFQALIGILATISSIVGKSMSTPFQALIGILAT